MTEKLLQGDCLELLPTIQDNSIDLILADLPYQMTGNQWVWQKTLPVGFLWSHHMPLRAHENIYVFYKHLPTYNPQMRQGFKPYKGHICSGSVNYNAKVKKYKPTDSNGERFPIDILEASNNIQKDRVHPTQKPVKLLKYLIKTYTDEGMTVLDNVMGSGSTGVAAKQLNRNFIGMELNKKYFEIAKQRIKEA